MAKNEEKAAAIGGLAGVGGAVAGYLLGSTTRPAVSDLTAVSNQLKDINIKLSIISEKLDELKQVLTVTLPEKMTVEGRYVYAVLADEVQAQAGQKFEYIWEIPVRRFSIYISVDGATDITLSLSPDSGDHIFNIGTIKSFTSAGDDVILIEHICNYFEVGTSNAVKITIFVAGLT